MPEKGGAIYASQFVFAAARLSYDLLNSCLFSTNRFFFTGFLTFVQSFHKFEAASIATLQLDSSFQFSQIQGGASPCEVFGDRGNEFNNLSHPWPEVNLDPALLGLHTHRPNVSTLPTFRS
jgi:hypothetical protein